VQNRNTSKAKAETQTSPTPIIVVDRHGQRVMLAERDVDLVYERQLEKGSEVRPWADNSILE
jgi:hypothetical protein